MVARFDEDASGTVRSPRVILRLPVGRENGSRRVGRVFVHPLGSFVSRSICRRNRRRRFTSRKRRLVSCFLRRRGAGRLRSLGTRNRSIRLNVYPSPRTNATTRRRRRQRRRQDQPQMNADLPQAARRPLAGSHTCGSLTIGVHRRFHAVRGFAVPSKVRLPAGRLPPVVESPVPSFCRPATCVGE